MSRIAHVVVIIDGEKISGFSKFKENARKKHERVKLMDGDDTVEVNPELGCSMTYLPESGADREWDGVKDATIIAQYKGGAKVTYTGCDVEEVGDRESDGQKANEFEVKFIAKARKVS